MHKGQPERHNMGTQFPPAYREALKRYNELRNDWLVNYLNMNDDQQAAMRAEMDRLAAVLDEYETAYAARQAGSGEVVWDTVLD